MTQVICGFPGVGKTVFCQSRANTLDSDSSHFSWSSPRVRNPNFPQNYIEHIKQNLGKVDYICVSSHKLVRDALRENNISYTIVYPDISLQDEYIERYKKRGSPRDFLVFLSANWNPFISDIETETFPKLVKLKAGQYLSDVYFKAREIQFRGKNVDTGEWIYGFYVEDEEGLSILRQNPETGSLERIRVVPESIGQFTGLKDRKGAKVFDADILQHDEYRHIGYANWNGAEAGFDFCIYKHGRFIVEYLWFYIDGLEVIGNVYDNPELLEEEK